MGMAEKLPKPARRRRESRQFALELVADAAGEARPAEDTPHRRAR